MTAVPFGIGGRQLEALSSAAGLGSDAAIYLGPIEPGGGVAAIDAGDDIYPASMIKIPLGVAVAADVAAARLSWDDRLDVDAANLTHNDAPSPLDRGAAATVAELVELMICRSDNVATNVLIDAVGRDRATAILHGLGFVDTAVRRKLSGSLPLIDDPAATGRNAHPAREAFALLRRIAGGSVPGAERIAALLAGQYWNTKLSAGLLPGDRFDHKTGDTDEVSHDGGILTLESGPRFVLVVYTRLPSIDEHDRRFGAFMRGLRPLLVTA